ncbi:TPA: hypothetical protein ACGIK9_003260 [Acinetobacter baumannii]|uniref:hypothetical protein n=1 Tax=Acinetobacter baumannii TaxID=470 RepID=UPI00338DEB9E
MSINKAEIYYFAEQLAKKTVLPILEKHSTSQQPVHGLYYFERPTVEFDGITGELRISLSLIGSSTVGINKIQSVMCEVLNLGWVKVLQQVFPLLEIQTYSLHCNSSALIAMHDETMNETECECDDVYIDYKHAVIFKLPSHSTKTFEKTIESNLKEMKKSSNKNKPTKTKLLTAINFVIEYSGKNYICSINESTRKVGFATAYDLEGNKLQPHSVTWDLWKIPTNEVYDLFKINPSNSVLKYALKSNLIKGAKLVALDTYRPVFTDSASDFSCYSQIHIKAYIEGSRNHLVILITIKKNGEIIVLDERGNDQTKDLESSYALLYKKLLLVHEYLFCSNKAFALAVLKDHDLCGFEPKSENGRLRLRLMNPFVTFA